MSPSFDTSKKSEVNADQQSSAILSQSDAELMHLNSQQLPPDQVIQNDAKMYLHKRPNTCIDLLKSADQEETKSMPTLSNLLKSNIKPKPKFKI